MSRSQGAALWDRHADAWRDPAQIISGWADADTVSPELLRLHTRGAWWETLGRSGITLVITREYEHLVMALSAASGCPQVSFLPLPHPSGVTVDRQQKVVYLASTRNPNHIYELRPVTSTVPRTDAQTADLRGHPLVPTRSTFLPGCLYIHDLAEIGGALHANAVGQNAVIRLDGDGSVEPVWWPRAIEGPEGPVFGRNHLQLNSIAAGSDIASSYFSASSETISHRRPGHKNYPVDGRGVIFSGATREPVARGLTRPHSARLHSGTLWVDNSGYGELGFIEDGGFKSVAILPGWTRGLCFHGNVAFVGTSQVLTRFRQYAPGLDVDRSVCGVHAVDTRSGSILGSAVWPAGNQIFAVDWIDSTVSSRLPFTPRQSRRYTERLFYTFQTGAPE